jgi:hypothetical protein
LVVSSESSKGKAAAPPENVQVYIERRRRWDGWVYGDFVKTKERKGINAGMKHTQKKRGGKSPPALSILFF